MPELTLSQLASATGGRLLSGDPHAVVRSFGIDTRRLDSGGVFFALRGVQTDGHRFLADAALRGAAAAVVEREPQPGDATPPATIVVDDAAAALASCGRWLRRHLTNRKWIAVTGSNGKTTTKEYIAAGLSARHRVHRTPGNLNNHLGVPLSMLACPDDAEVVVLELGMSAHGEIAFLTEIVDPDIGLVTNVRAAHLGAFGTLDEIAAAKGEIYALMRDEATSIVNLDDVHVRIQSMRHVGARVTFGQQSGADLRLEELLNRFVPGAAMIVSHDSRTYRVQLRIGGAHSAFNALAAAAVAVAAGIDLTEAFECMERLEAGPGRGRVHRLRGGMLLVDDSYNSSPSALASVLETLRLSEPVGRRVLAMGDMLELGRVEGALHREAGRRAASAGVRLLFTVGPLSRGAAEAARRAGVSEVHHHADSDQAAEAIGEYVKDGDLIVVKGSRGMHMERVVQALSSRFSEEN